MKKTKKTIHLAGFKCDNRPKRRVLRAGELTESYQECNCLSCLEALAKLLDEPVRPS